MKKEKSEGNAVAELTREGLYKENKWLWEENKKLKEEKEELEKEVERLQKVLYTITGRLDDGEPDLYEDC